MPKVRRRAAADRLALTHLHGGIATYLPGETLRPRTMGDYELVWIMGGRVTYHTEGRDYPAPPGTIILARPGAKESYTWDPKRTTRHAYFHFGFATTPSDWPAPSRWPLSRLAEPGDTIRPLFRAVVERWCLRRRRHTPERWVERLVETLLAEFIAGTRDETHVPERELAEPVRRTFEWIGRVLADEPARSVKLNDLAAAASVTPKHLCRLFTTTLGLSPMEAVRLLKLEEAAALLARSNLNVKEIAARYGFASPQHFSRCFSTVYRASPREMRSQTAGGAPPPPGPLTRITLPGRPVEW